MSGGQHPHLLRRGLLLGHRMWMVAKLIYMEQMMLGFENWWLSPPPSPRNLPVRRYSKADEAWWRMGARPCVCWLSSLSLSSRGWGF